MESVEKTSDIASAHKLEGSHLGALEDALNTPNDDLHADILGAVLRAIRSRTDVSWLTPLSRLVEALVAAGRTEEAAVTGNASGLTVGRNREPVNVFIARWKGPRRQAPAYDALLGQMADLVVRTWRFR
jgi:hypothetical protein